MVSRSVLQLKWFLWFGMLCTFPTEVLAQEQDSLDENVRNVHFESLGDQVSISYDLQGSSEDEYQVTVALRRGSDPSFNYSLMKASGDVGKGVFAGMHKKILWGMKEEFPEGLSGDDYYFVVNANPVSSGSSSAFLWVGVGVAALGGVATYFLLQHSNDETPAAISSGFPAPPGRP